VGWSRQAANYVISSLPFHRRGTHSITPAPHNFACSLRGKLVVVGVSPEPIEVPSFVMVGQSASVVGHASGTSIESEDTLRFSAMSGVRPMIETMPLERAPEAYARMMSGEARFRMVLTMG